MRTLLTYVHIFIKSNPFDVQNKEEMRLLHNEMFKGKSSLSCLQQFRKTHLIVSKEYIPIYHLKNHSFSMKVAQMALVSTFFQMFIVLGMCNFYGVLVMTTTKNVTPTVNII